MGDIKDAIDLLMKLAKSAKERETAAVLFQIHAQVADTASENFKLHKEILELKSQLSTCVNEKTVLMQKPDDEAMGDMCPFCRRRAGKLLEIKPHDTFGDLGLKTGYYECALCQKKYDKELKA